MNEVSVPNKPKSPVIILLISSLAGGGSEKVMANLANNYAKRGISVILVTLNDPTGKPDVYTLSSQVRRISLFVPSSRNIFSKIFAHWKRYQNLRQVLLTKKPDVLLSFMTPTNILAIFSTHGLNVRCVVSERTNPMHYSYGLIYNLLRYFLFRNADCVVAQTQTIAHWLLHHTASRTVTVPNFLTKNTSLLPKSRMNQVVAVGRLDRVKRFDLLISAYAKLTTDFPDWTLVIAGEGPERKALQGLIDQFSLQQQVKLCGFIEQPDNILQRAAIAVQPSCFEGFPNALLEAMASGLPVVATHEAGAMLINDGVNGLLIPVDNVQALVNALKQLMENPQLREQLGEAALEVRKTHSEERVTKLWDEVLFPSQRPVINLAK